MPTIDTVTLTRLTYGERVSYPEAPGVELRHTSEYHMALQVATVNVIASVLGQRLEDQRLAWPADWWQAVKQRFAPEWFKRRWPVRMERWRASVDRVYPDIVIPPNQRYYIVPIVQLEWRETRADGEGK